MVLFYFILKDRIYIYIKLYINFIKLFDCFLEVILSVLCLQYINSFLMYVWDLYKIFLYIKSQVNISDFCVRRQKIKIQGEKSYIIFLISFFDMKILNFLVVVC